MHWGFMWSILIGFEAFCVISSVLVLVFVLCMSFMLYRSVEELRSNHGHVSWIIDMEVNCSLSGCKNRIL